MKNAPSLFILLTSAFILISCSTAPVPAATLQPGTQSNTPSLPATPAATPASSAMLCTVLHLPATPEALGAEFESRGHITGPANAPVTIVVFSNYQCPACAYVAISLKKIRMDHPNDVRLVYIHTPLAEHDKDSLAVQAAEAADLQGKFWEMNDLLFVKQAEWSALAPAGFEAWAVQQAASLGMDSDQFQADFRGKVVAERLQQAAQSSGSQSVALPVLFINSTSRYTGLADFASLDTVVRMEALTARQFSACPPWITSPLKQYLVTLHTAKGNAVIQLYPDKAPLAVNNFVFLARHGWYDNITFYRVLPNQLAMTGDPSETGMGNPGYLFETEIPASLHFDRAGMVAMDNSGPGTNGSRFFITLDPTAQLNGQYTIFGQVLSGLDILSSLTPRDPHPQPGVQLPPGDTLISVTIEEH